MSIALELETAPVARLMVVQGGVKKFIDVTCTDVFGGWYSVKVAGSQRVKKRLQ